MDAHILDALLRIESILLRMEGAEGLPGCKSWITSQLISEPEPTILCTEPSGAPMCEKCPRRQFEAATPQA